MFNLLLFLLSLVLPGAGQVIKDEWKKGIVFFLLAVLPSFFAGMLSRTEVIGNDMLLSILCAFDLWNASIRLWSAVDAAIHSSVSTHRKSKFFKGALITSCILFLLVFSDRDKQERFSAFKVHEKSSMMEPLFSAGTMVLVTAPQYWERELAKGDFVVINTNISKKNKKSPFLFKIYGKEGEPFPPDRKFDAKIEAIKARTELIPKGHYLVGATRLKQINFLVTKDKISAKAFYIYWPVSKIGKL